MTITMYSSESNQPLANGKLFLFKPEAIKKPEGLVATIDLDENGSANLPQEFLTLVHVTSEHYSV